MKPASSKQGAHLAWRDLAEDYDLGDRERLIASIEKKVVEFIDDIE